LLDFDPVGKVAGQPEPGYLAGLQANYRFIARLICQLGMKYFFINWQINYLSTCLKKTVSILLLGVLIFNWFGYRLVIAYMEDQAKLQLELKLDETNYDETQLLSIKVPASNLAYYTNSSLFERVDGQIEIEGIQYKYVKRRLYRDSLELLCIPDQAAMRLQEAKYNFFQLVNDLLHNGQGKKSGLHPTSLQDSISDCDLTNDFSHFAGQFPSRILNSPQYGAIMPSCYLMTPEQPPENI
jgi:hypothetical protein